MRVDAEPEGLPHDKSQIKEEILSWYNLATSVNVYSVQNNVSDTIDYLNQRI